MSRLSLLGSWVVESIKQNPLSYLLVFLGGLICIMTLFGGCNSQQDKVTRGVFGFYKIETGGLDSKDNNGDTAHNDLSNSLMAVSQSKTGVSIFGCIGTMETDTKFKCDTSRYFFVDQMFGEIENTMSGECDILLDNTISCKFYGDMSFVGSNYTIHSEYNFAGKLLEE